MITEEQRRYVLEHQNERPYTKVAKDAGISIRTLYSVLRKQDRSTLRKKERWSMQKEKAARVVPELYAAMSEREIEKEYGIDRHFIRQVAKRLGLKHSQETISRLRKKGGLKTQQVWKADRTRYLSGQPQLTKFRIAKYSHKLRLVVNRLIRVYNYFTDEEVGGLYTLYYDEDTKRTPNEHTFSKRYGLKFEKA